MAFRPDGLDNPLSPNSGALTWDDVAVACEESPAVESYEETDGGMEITWCDGTIEQFAHPNIARNAIRAVSAV